MLSHFSLYQPKPLHRLIMHLLFWLALFVIRCYLGTITFNVYGGLPFSVIFQLNLGSTLLIAGIFYLLVGPFWRLLERKRYVVLAVAMLCSLSMYTLSDAILEQQVLTRCAGCFATMQNNQPEYAGLLRSGLINIVLKRLLSLGMPLGLLLMLSIPLCIKLALKAWRSNVRTLQLAKDKLELEFNFLKAQLNPHFLFNSMNNIYGLILAGNLELSAGLVARLSALLRYMLYESDAPYMSLQKEIELLCDYVELEKVRLNDTSVSFEHEEDRDSYMIAPLLLVPLLENAFKFCADEPGAYIRFFLKVRDGRLHFTLDNSLDTNRRGFGGIGLTNFRKRLDLYYSGRYTYEPRNDGKVYSVALTIDL